MCSSMQATECYCCKLYYTNPNIKEHIDAIFLVIFLLLPFTIFLLPKFFSVLDNLF